jgi:hypothetical protein
MVEALKKSPRNFIAITAVILLGLGAAILFVPWKMAVQSKLQVMLQEKGFENAALTLSGIGWHEARISDVTIGPEKNLGLKNLILNYTPLDLWRGQLRNIELSGLMIMLKQLDGKWQVQGYRSSDAAAASSFPLPLSQQGIDAIPFDSFGIKDSQVNAIADKWHVTAPLNLQWHKTPQPSLLLTSDNGEFFSSGVAAKIVHAEAKAAFDEGIWQGDWVLKDVTSLPSMPLLQGSGMIKADKKNIQLAGKLGSADNIYTLQFKLDAQVKSGEPIMLTIQQATMLWKSGKLFAQNIQVPLMGETPIKVNLQVEKVSVDELLQALTGKRVSATGFVSGSIPLTVRRDGTLTFGQGNLHSTEDGVITMPPDALPGDNPQVQLTRDILKDFHYQNLGVVLKNEAGGGIALLLALDGNNPDIYEGRPVKLNVNLSGDVLDFVKQNAMLMNSPEIILKQEKK